MTDHKPSDSPSLLQAQFLGNNRLNTQWYQSFRTQEQPGSAVQQLLGQRARQNSSARQVSEETNAALSNIHSI